MTRVGFAAALDAVRMWGGVIEHPKDSKAFGAEFGFNLGKLCQGWLGSFAGRDRLDLPG